MRGKKNRGRPQRVAELDGDGDYHAELHRRSGGRRKQFFFKKVLTNATKF